MRKEEGSKKRGIYHAQLLASQLASQTLMTVMSCHTGCLASQQILPLSLPFSNQCYWSVSGVKGQEHINQGNVADAADKEGLTPDGSMTFSVCHWFVMIIHLLLTEHINRICFLRKKQYSRLLSIIACQIVWVGELFIASDNLLPGSLLFCDVKNKKPISALSQLRSHAANGWFVFCSQTSVFV